MIMMFRPILITVVVHNVLQLPVDDSSVLLSHPTVTSSSASLLSASKDDDLWSMGLGSQKLDRIETAQQVSDRTLCDVFSCNFY